MQTKTKYKNKKKSKSVPKISRVSLLNHEKEECLEKNKNIANSCHLGQNNLCSGSTTRLKKFFKPWKKIPDSQLEKKLTEISQIKRKKPQLQKTKDKKIEKNTQNSYKNKYEPRKMDDNSPSICSLRNPTQIFLYNPDTKRMKTNKEVTCKIL